MLALDLSQTNKSSFLSDKTNFDELCDNRDFSVILNWDPRSVCDMEKIKQHSYQEEVSPSYITTNLTFNMLNFQNGYIHFIFLELLYYQFLVYQDENLQLVRQH